MEKEKAIAWVKRGRSPMERRGFFLMLPTETQMAILRDTKLDETILDWADSSVDFLTNECKLLLAQKPSCPGRALNLFSSFNNEFREAVGKNPSTPDQTLMFLACDTEEFVRETARHNPSATPEVIAAISASQGYVMVSQDYIESAAAQRINELKKRHAEQIANRQIVILDDYRKPAYGRALYRIKESGDLQYVLADWDHSG